MGTPNMVLPPGQGTLAPARSFALKLLGVETGESIMMFEETIPPGTKSTYHLHHDSDELAYVLSGEVTIKIGDQITVGRPGSCTFMPRGVPHAWKSTGTRNRARAVSVHAGQGRLLDRRAATDRPQSRIDE